MARVETKSGRSGLLVKRGGKNSRILLDGDTESKLIPNEEYCYMKNVPVGTVVENPLLRVEIDRIISDIRKRCNEKAGGSIEKEKEIWKAVVNGIIEKGIPDVLVEGCESVGVEKELIKKEVVKELKSYQTELTGSVVKEEAKTKVDLEKFGVSKEIPDVEKRVGSELSEVFKEARTGFKKSVSIVSRETLEGEGKKVYTGELIEERAPKVKEAEGFDLTTEGF